MALQIWLPLVSDFSNQGVAGASLTNSSAVLSNGGKLGAKYLSSGSLTVPASSSAQFFNNNSMTLAAWIYPIGTSGSSQFMGQSSMAVGNNRMYSIFQYPTPNDLHLSWQDETSTGTFLGGVWNGFFPADQWTHMCITYNGSVAIIYRNGEQYATANGTSNRAAFNYDFPINGSSIRKMNDVRVYNHVLSAKEVKLLAQGLVVHYPLNDQYNASNLVYNGYGENGSDGWNGTTISTSDLPTADSNIKATFLGGYTDLFPINPKNTYALQCYMKVNGSSSGYIYPSLFPYDIDGKFIDHHRCGIGFNTSWQATLTQPLKYGDTVLYCSDLSAWSTANNNYYDHVAIFGYKDSKGNVYPDFEYTQDSPAFGTYSDKSKINKTNNTITLNSAYTGADRPAGTKICQATEGGTYYYPWGGLESSNLTSWTLKTTTISFANDSRLKYAHYLRWSTYNTKAYYAGIKITDSTWGTNTIYDASGNQNNGTITGITCSQNSARYKFSSFFYDYTRTLQTPLVLTTPTAITMAVWIKSSSTGRGSYQMPLNINSAAYEFSIDSSGKFRQGFYVNGARKVVTTSSKNVLDGLWHHLAATFDGNNIKRYVDGELIHTESVSGTLTTTSMLYVSTYGTDLTYGNVNMYENDIRVYATALSADDIKELYQTSGSIANNGTMLAYEFIES